MPTPDDKIGLFPIRTVSELTGVNSITLRAWERRYGLIKPHRTAKGHRLYTQQDIDWIKHVVDLLEQGVPISRARAVLQRPVINEAPTGSGPWGHYQQRMFRAIIRFDEFELERVYNEAMSLYPVDIVTRLLLVPLLQELGERWQNAEDGVAEEHFFSVYMRNKIGARFHHREQNPNQHGDRLVAACLPDEYHELGLLLFALAAHDRGLHLTLLGADMPISELHGVARTVDAHAIVLSGAVISDLTIIRNELATVVEGLKIPVFIGGGASVTYCGELAEAGAIPLGENLLQGLTLIQQRLHRDAGPSSDKEPS